MTAQPFCLALGQGTAATQGINFYPLNGVPNPVTFTNTSIFSLGFNLTGVGTYVNGILVGTAPIVNYGEYTVLFDSYRIRKVQIDMYYNSNSSTLGPGTSLPMISIANDYDDVNSTSLASLSQYDSYRQIQFGNNCNNGRQTHSLKPKVQSTVETVAGSTLGLQAAKDPWIDCNTTTALYCGVKGNYDNMNVQAVSVGLVTFYVKFFVEFKNTR